MKKKQDDRRVRLTRELLRRAFMTLLAEKPIEEISIKELCDLAQVNRSTFYAHYTDLRDLLRQIEDEMFEEFSQALDNLYQPGRDGVEPVVVTTGVFQCLKDNSDLCVVTLGPHGDKNFALRLLQCGREYCFANYAFYFKGATRQQVEYCYAFISSGCIGLLNRWLEDGMQMEPAELAR
ncbi:MAG TPA: TetR/AcrR family transcriptional regulator C-terminal domain-containing protein, partial [Candidatus Pygmaiobacter gallistercoris]|nr:TetR/AcrR family transcriptional regulator C-terminal domain-containing protein [Candidatus Pygmaiobacter gallistercoris]